MRVIRNNVELEIDEDTLEQYKKEGYIPLENLNTKADKLDANEKKTLKDMTVAELKEIAKERGIDNADSLTKKELLALLTEQL